MLTGRVNPSGRLTETYAYSVKDIPSEHTRRDENVMVYEEGLNVGYRHFASRNVPVLYPFGFGLSYSDFRYSDLQVEVSGDSVEVRLWVENVSDTDGKEVVQLYVHEEAPVVYRPIRELKAFEKVLVKAHEKKQIVLTLDRSAFAYYSAQKKQWTVNDGTFVIQIGKNANEILLEKKIAFAENGN